MTDPDQSRAIGNPKTGRRLFLMRTFFVIFVLIPSIWWGGNRFLRSYPRGLLSQSSLLVPAKMYSNLGMLVVFGSTSQHQILCAYMKGYFAYDFLLIDTQTGQQTLLKSLSTAQNKRASTPDRLSPDGRWLYCWAKDDHHTYYYLFEVHGTRIYSQVTSLQQDVDFFWTVDSQACIGLDSQNKCLLKWSLASPQHLAKLSQINTSGDLWGCNTTPYGLIATPSLLYAKQGKPVSIVALPIVDGRHVRPLGQIVLQSGGSLSEVKVCPRGKRLAWLVTYSVPPPKFAWLRWLYRRLGQSSGEYEALWTSNIDGSDAHEIGHIQVNLDVNPRKYIGFWGWTYHGEALWYEYAEQFWRVKVD